MTPVPHPMTPGPHPMTPLPHPMTPLLGVPGLETAQAVVC